MARTSNDALRAQNEALSAECDKLRAQFKDLHEAFMRRAHQHDLCEAALADAQAHVKRLRLIIEQRYANLPKGQRPITPEQARWQAAAAYARKHPGVTVQQAIQSALA